MVREFEFEFCGGPADGLVEKAEDFIPDLIDGLDRKSFLTLGDTWYIVRAIDWNKSRVYYEPIKLTYFPDAILGDDGIAILNPKG